MKYQSFSSIAKCLGFWFSVLVIGYVLHLTYACWIYIFNFCMRVFFAQFFISSLHPKGKIVFLQRYGINNRQTYIKVCPLWLQPYTSDYLHLHFHFQGFLTFSMIHRWFGLIVCMFAIRSIIETLLKLYYIALAQRQTSEWVRLGWKRAHECHKNVNMSNRN